MHVPGACDLEEQYSVSTSTLGCVRPFDPYDLRREGGFG